MTTQPRIPLDDLTSDALDALYDERDDARLKAVNLERDLRTERWYAEDRKRGLRLQRQRAETAEARVRELEAQLARANAALRHMLAQHHKCGIDRITELEAQVARLTPEATP
ncbi:hypothetical protein ABZW50_08610 [Streptomyces bacillaris]